MLIACAMCGGTIEVVVPVIVTLAATAGAELYNRARRAAHNRRKLAARLAELAASNPPAAGVAGVKLAAK